MIRRYDCSLHGNFTANATSILCPRCLDKESKGETDLKTEEFKGVYINACERVTEIAFKEAAENIKKELEACKHDGAKPDLSLLPKEFLDEVAKAFMHGEKKYGRYNFISGMDWHRIIAASLRHITAFNAGEDNDSESGLSHLSHAGACIAMLLVYTSKGLGKDTRYKL